MFSFDEKPQGHAIDPTQPGLPMVAGSGGRTLALRAGLYPRVVQERLGHANVSITLDTYSHVDMEMQVLAAAQVSALVTGDGE